MLELRGLSKSFDATPVLRDVSLSIRQGEFFSLLGPSGCGKTTLLRILAGFEQATAGEIHFGGRRIDGLPPHQRHFNMVFQRYALFPHLDVRDNVAFGLRMKKVAEPEVASRVDEILKLVKMDDYARRSTQTLSGGQQQRVALARALVNRPSVLLLDEPLSALDLKLRQEMQVELRALQRRLKITFIFVTHDQEEALALSDRIAVMNEGRVEQLGSPREIYERPATGFVARFIGSANLLTDAQGCRFLVRPEKVRVARVRPEKLGEEESLVSGVLKEVLYLGPVVQWVIQPEESAVPGGAEAAPVIALQPSFSENFEQGIHPGERVHVLWSKRDAVFAQD